MLDVVSICIGPNRVCGQRCSEPIKGKIEPKRRLTKGTHIEHYLKIQNYHSRCNGYPYAYLLTCHDSILLETGRFPITGLRYDCVSKARFTLGVRANVQPKSSIPIGAKSWNWPQGLYTRSQAWNRKKDFNLPQVLTNAELYGLELAPRLEKGYHQIWEANLQPKNAQSWARGFLALTPSVKWA